MYVLDIKMYILFFLIICCSFKVEWVLKKLLLLFIFVGFLDGIFI